MNGTEKISLTGHARLFKLDFISHLISTLRWISLNPARLTITSFTIRLRVYRCQLRRSSIFLRLFSSSFDQANLLLAIHLREFFYLNSKLYETTKFGLPPLDLQSLLCRLLLRLLFRRSYTCRNLNITKENTQSKFFIVIWSDFF